MVAVRLGCIFDLGEEFPDAVSILCLPCPRSALHALVTPSSLPVRFCPKHLLDSTCVVLVAPPPKRRPHQFTGNSAANRTQVEQWLEGLWQYHLGATLLMPAYCVLASNCWNILKKIHLIYIVGKKLFEKKLRIHSTHRKDFICVASSMCVNESTKTTFISELHSFRN